MFKTNLVLGFMLIMLLAMSTSLMAVDYVVSGAGTAGVNGTYVEDVVVNGKTSYKYEGATTYYLFFQDNYWAINNNNNFEMIEMTYYYVSSSADTPPSSGWNVGEMGESPAPTVEVDVARLSYSPETFQESSDNDGTISNSLTITYGTPGSDYFTGSNGTFAISKYTASNVPAGLTMVITRNSNLELSVSLTGTATNSNNANDISNLQIAFNNTAFNNGDASAVNSSTKSDLNVNFIQQYEVASSGGDFTTITAAIAAADADGGDIINIAAYTLTEAGITVSKDLTIQGQGADATIVQAHAIEGSASDGVFEISEDITATIKNLTIRHGKRRYGGGIDNDGDLTLENLTVCDNQTYDPSQNRGGGIFSPGTMTITNSTISGNSVSGDNRGGGIFATGTIVITNSTITDNSASWGGGAIRIYNVTLNNCTITNNSSGIYTNNNTLTISNTILADNGTTDYYVVYSGTLNDNGYNIVENQTYSGTPSDWKFSATTNILYNYKADGSSSTSWNRNNVALENQNLNLSSTLADNNTINGTQTLKTTSGSFAIDAGTASGAPTTDQRGANRNGATDIGAYEWWDDDGTLPVTLSNFTAQYIENIPVLCWTTQSETDNAGWNIYRGENEEALSNEEAYMLNLSLGLIPGAGSTSEPTEYSFEDVFPVYAGTTYFYWLESVDYSGESEIYGPISLTIPENEWQNPNSPEIPKPYGLHQNYPNPFNPSTEISFMLKESCIGELSIYNIKGQKIKTIFSNLSILRDEMVISNWNGKDESGKEVSTGVYYYKLQTTKGNYVRKMILLK